ncbi:GDSL esterase/lipase At4g26790 [Cryptomeria japonica]|uniref:GDSL esterase/lipase At4g26790 n=1 Tax=Cryptomeria japonica TaxID=3369 RepID=UPI0027D9E439|nr:GDSL esterase/lipase At4g26790 [Cryptomeria japonica]
MKSRAESLVVLSVFLTLTITIAQKCDYILFVGGQKVPAIFMFGDSYGDTGNNDFIITTVASDFPPYGRDFEDRIPTGRFSNGKLISDYFVEGLGIKELLPPYLDPNLNTQDLLTGVCFGSSGTGLDNLTAQISNVIPVWKQIEYFREYRNRIEGLVGEEEATTIIRNAIFFITIGTNDFIVNYFTLPIPPLQFTVQEYTGFLLNTYTVYIQELYNLGATRFALINVPPLGCLPIERTLRSLLNRGACDEEINQAASGFNSGLNAMIDGLKSTFPRLQIVSLDYNNLISEFIANPSKYGFEVIARGCCGTGTVEISFICNELSPFTCPDASKYLFFDSVHFTQKAYQIISNTFLTRDVPQLL